ncbi:hypothetical protein V1499_19735 [Neobacillus sp. SCS-31]|uniref:hypothetical protein n=1 Tax=Neobacillus oceani TaxID=3115292 RepID=UPI00390587CF
MSKFIFETDDVSEEFCLEIVDIMMKDFNIAEEEAMGRINSFWSRLSIIREYDLVHHELPKTWAYDIYFGPDSEWWKKDPKTLEPKPFP